MARKKKEIEFDIPESVCLFNKAQVLYITQAAKMIPYQVDIQKAQISVPISKEKEAAENLVVIHLVNSFGFEVQLAMDVPENKVFDPEIRTGSKIDKTKKLTVPDHKSTEIVIGATFKDTREHCTKRIFGEVGSKWIIMYVGDMRPNYNMDKGSVTVAFNSGIFVF